MKQMRHNKILELIKNEPIETQEQLAKRLTECGYDVTQATVSRDIKALHLSKTQRNGVSCYTLTPIMAQNQKTPNYYKLLAEAVVGADYAGNIAVIKCHAGTANAAAAALDSTTSEEILGSVAGDDTVILVLRTEQNAARFTEEMKALIQ